MKGRKAKPPAKKRLQGNPGKRTSGKDSPQFDPSTPAPPGHLDEVALEEWYRITDLMSGAKTISPAFLALLASYCQTYSEIIQLTKKLEGENRWLTSKTEYVYENPRHIRLGKLRQELRTYITDLGLSPVTISKAHVIPGDGNKADPKKALAEKLFKGAKVKS